VSEFRDLTLAMRAMHDSMTSIEHCLAILVRDSAQQTKWRHDQKNLSVIDTGRWEAQERATSEVQTAVSSLMKTSFEIREEMRTLRDTQFDGAKELRGRVRRLEDNASQEVTKA